MWTLTYTIFQKNEVRRGHSDIFDAGADHSVCVASAMKLSQLLRLAAKTRELVFRNPSTKSLRFLTGVNATYDSGVGGYLVLVNEPPQKEGQALVFKLTEPGRLTWVSVRRIKKDWQVDAFG